MKKIFEIICLMMLLANSSLFAQDRLVIISPHWEGVRIEITRGFKNWYAQKYGENVEIEWIDQGGASDNLKFVESLFVKSPEGIGIDMFFGGGVDPYLRLKDLGLLQRYRVSKETLAAIPPTCAGIPNYDRNHYWYGVVLSGFGILYNKRVLDFLDLPYPESWESLGEPHYFSWVGASDPRHSGSMHMMYEIILQAYGWNKGWQVILALAGNTKHFSTSASAAAKNTSSGEVAISLSIDSYALAQIEANGPENIGFILPEKLTVINPDGVGIIKGAENLTTAQRFIDYLLSFEGQLIWMLPKGSKEGPEEYSLNRFGIREDVYMHPAVKKSGDFNPYAITGTIDYDFQLAGRRWTLVNDLIGATVIDCHRTLKKAWQITIQSDKKELRERFFQIPFDSSLQRFLWENWSNPVFRNHHINEWQKFSLDKFNSIIRQSRLYR